VELMKASLKSQRPKSPSKKVEQIVKNNIQILFDNNNQF
jgi:hypothetical protein